MAENSQGFIRPVAEPVHLPDKVRIVDAKGQIRLVKVAKGRELSHSQGYRLLRPKSEVPRPGEVPSIHTWVNMAKLQPGGCVDEHFHEYGPDMPVFDHVYFVISGRIRAKIGEMEETVGAGGLIYCPSNVKHSVTNVGKGVAKVLKIAAAGEGEKLGAPVYSKMPRLSAGA